MSALFRPHRKLFVGVVHLKPLPGSPRWGGDLETVIASAVADARAYERGAVDGIIVENFGDAPFTKNSVAPETLTAMTAAGCAIRAAVKVPIGFNVLRNDAHSALALLFADIHVKHAVPLGNFTIEDSAHDTLERGLADALIISGTGTGVAADIGDVQRVRRACPKAKILLGSGVTVENAREFMRVADGAIVGSSLKRDGKLDNPVDPRRVAALRRALS